VAGVAFAVYYGLWPLWHSSGRKDSDPSDAGTQVAAPLSPARQLVERARAITSGGSLTRAQLDAAGELCDRALELDPDLVSPRIMLAERAADIIKGKGMLEPADVPVGVGQDWETLQRSSAS